MGMVKNILGKFFGKKYKISSAETIKMATAQKKSIDKSNQKEKKLTLRKELESDGTTFSKPRSHFFKTARSKAIQRNKQTDLNRRELKEFGNFKAMRYSWYYPAKV